MKKAISLVGQLALGAILCLTMPQNSSAQALSNVETAEKKVKEAQEKVDAAQKAVDDEIARLKKEGERDPKAHGTTPELNKLRKELEDAKAKLLKAKEALKKAAQAAVDRAQKALDREKKKQRPSAQKLAEAEKALEEAKKKLDEIQKAEETAVPENGARDMEPKSYFLVALTADQPFGALTTQSFNLPDLQAALFEPNAVEQLFKAIEGEFFPSSLSGKPISAFELTGQPQFSSGLHLGFGLGKGFELHAQGQYFRATWNGQFPLTVFPFEPLEPYTIQGNLNASAKGLVAAADVAFFPINGTLQPYLKVGVRGIFSLENQSSAEVAGVSMPIDIQAIETNFSPFASAGLRVSFLKNGFLQAGISYGKVPGADYLPSAEIGIGWRFRGKQVQQKKELVFHKHCKCEGIYATVVITNLTRKNQLENDLKEYKEKLKQYPESQDYKDEVARIEKRLSDKVFEETREVAQDIVSRIAEAGDAVDVIVKAINIGSKICHCDAEENKEPDCTFYTRMIREINDSGAFQQFNEFDKGEDPDAKNTTFWSRTYHTTRERPYAKFDIHGSCKKPGSECGESEVGYKKFQITFQK